MSERNYGAVRSAEKFEVFVDRLISQGKPVGFDIEASYSATEYIEKGALLQFHPTWFLTGFSFTNSTDWARYVPVAHADGNNVDDVVRTARALWRMLTHVGDDGKSLIVAHNLAYEIKGCRRWFKDVLWNDPEVGEEVRAADGVFGGLADSMLEVWLSAEYEPARSNITTKDLKGITKMAFGHEMTTFDELFMEEGRKKASKDKRFHLLDSTNPKHINYACEDAVWCLALHEKHYPALKDDFIFKTEMALLPVLIEMEIEGLHLDWTTISKKAAEVNEFKDLMNEEILQELSERLGEVVNINLGSVKQLSEVLYVKLGLPVKERSEKTNAPSTSEGALRAIAKADPVIKQILEWREVSKLYGSYLHKYETELNYAGTGRAYPNHNQAGALTGRLSVDGVSYQQWPKPYHYDLRRMGKTFDLNFRDLLIAPQGFRIVGYDFSQVELRVLAGLANERALLQAFEDDVDIHRATASQMMGIPLDQVTKIQRSQGKTLNFAVVYGSGANNIAELLNTPEHPVTKEDAQDLLDKYFAAFSGLKAWMDTKVAEGREQGYVHTLFGRKFTVWEYKDSRDWIRAKGDRMCVNAPVQGGAADYMKVGMVRAQKAIKAAGMQDKIRLIMTVHDALEFYVHESVSTQEVIDIVNPAVTFRVRGLPDIRADWHEGKKWGSVVEIKLDKVSKQIVGYGLEDVDETFGSIEDAYEYMEKKNSEAAAEEAKKSQVDAQSLKEKRADLVAEEQDLAIIAAVAELDAGLESVEVVAKHKRRKEAELKGKSMAPQINHSLFPEDYPDPEDLEVEKPEPKDDRDGLTRAQFSAYHRSAKPGQGVEDWLTETGQARGVDADEEEPPWLHSPGYTPMALEPQTATVVVTEMPDERQYLEFKKFLDERPGQDTVVFSTPEGDITMDSKHTLTKEHQPQLSLLLGGASLTFVTDTVDADLVTEGLDL